MSENEQGQPPLPPEREKPPLERVHHIEIDEIPAVREFAESIKDLPRREQIKKISDFIHSKFKDAIGQEVRALPRERQEEIEASVLENQDPENPKKLSECMALGYGVCIEYTALAKALFDLVGIRCEVKQGQVILPGGRETNHMYLDIQPILGMWQIFDAFSSAHYKKPGALLDEAYYTASRTR